MSKNSKELQFITTKHQDTKILYLDVLRVVSALQVVMLHLLAFYQPKLQVTSRIFAGLSYVNAWTRTAVPSFFMLSGALLLDRDIPLRDLLKKYCWRIFRLWLIWTFIFAFITIPIKTGKWDLFESCSLIKSGVLIQRSSLWYLLSLLGCYLMQPFLRILVKQMDQALSLKIYIFSLIVIFIVFPEIITLKGTMPPIISAISEHLRLTFPRYSAYFLIGYLLHNTEFQSFRGNRFLYSSIYLILIIITGLSFKIDSIKAGNLSEIMLAHYSPSVFFASITQFLFLKICEPTFQKYHRLSKHISDLGKLTLGLYLFHPLLIDTFYYVFKIDILSIPHIYLPISLLAMYLAVLSFSFFTTYILSKIPYLRILIN